MAIHRGQRVALLVAPNTGCYAGGISTGHQHEGNAMSTVNCPHCKSVIRIAEPRKTSGCAWLALILICVPLGLMMFGDKLPKPANGPAPAAAPAGVSLTATAKQNQFALAIHNGDGQPWENVRVTIDTGLPMFGGYTFRMNSIGAGESVTIPLNEFASGGERWNPVAKKLGYVGISANIGGQRGHWAAQP